MTDVALSDLALEAQQEFQRKLGSRFKLVSCKVMGESNYRGGFTLEFSDGIRHLVAAYGDLEFEARLDGRELFGPDRHGDFAGIMFSREHLREHLHRIVEATLCGLPDES